MSMVPDTDLKTDSVTAPGLHPGLEQTMEPVSVTVPEPGLALDLVLATVKEIRMENVKHNGYGVETAESRGTYIGRDFGRGVASGSGSGNYYGYGCPETDLRNETNFRSGKGFAIGSGEDNGSGHG